MGSGRMQEGNTAADLAQDKGHRDIADMINQASRNPVRPLTQKSMSSNLLR